jgi:hypothetical protein
MLISTLSACFIGDEDAGGWASRNEIIEAANRCGISDFEPTEAGAGWAAYVAGEDSGKGRKSNCIYDDLHRQGLKVTR